MRDILIILIGTIAALVVAVLLYLYGGTLFNPSSLPQPKADVTVIAEGSYAAGIGSRVNYRIKDSDQFGTLWKMVYSDNGPSVSQIDFSRYEVLAVFDDSHSTGGYDVSVSKVQDLDGTRMVHIVYSVPGEDCPVKDGPSSPFVFVQVGKTSIPLTHTDETRVASCL